MGITTDRATVGMVTSDVFAKSTIASRPLSQRPRATWQERAEEREYYDRWFRRKGNRLPSTPCAGTERKDESPDSEHRCRFQPRPIRPSPALVSRADVLPAIPPETYASWSSRSRPAVNSNRFPLPDSQVIRSRCARVRGV